MRTARRPSPADLHSSTLCVVDLSRASRTETGGELRFQARVRVRACIGTQHSDGGLEMTTTRVENLSGRAGRWSAERMLRFWRFVVDRPLV